MRPHGLTATSPCTASRASTARVPAVHAPETNLVVGACWTANREARGGADVDKLFRKKVHKPPSNPSRTWYALAYIFRCEMLLRTAQHYRHC